MWTSLLPLAWSARSPWRELTSFIDVCSGLTPPPDDRISPRLRSSASLYVAKSIVLSPKGPQGAVIGALTKRHFTTATDQTKKHGPGLSSATHNAEKHEPGLSLRPRITRRNTNRVSLFGHGSRGETQTGPFSLAADHREGHRTIFWSIRVIPWNPWPHFPVESVATRSRGIR